MSLHNLAQHMKNAGRGDDKMLMHMTPGEVQGLQSLAMAHGGSLTINPETGLPEAGFLSSLLPTLIGAGLSIASGGALTPLMSAGLVGGGTALATGSLQKGLMAGLGAYGGAGLGAGLASVGSAAAGTAGAAGSSLGTAATDAAAKAAIGSSYATIAPAAANAATTVANAGLPGVVSHVAGYGTNIPNAVASATKLPNLAVAAPDRFGTAMQGLKSSFADTGGMKRLYEASEAAAPYSSLASGAGILLGANEPFKPPKESKSLIRPYTLARRRVLDRDVGPSSSAEQRYFDDEYTAQTPYEAPGPEYAAAGGIMSLADGGVVENMSNMNTLGGNAGYPMASLQAPNYSIDYARPEISSVINPSGDVAVDPYTGEPRYAGGGGVVALAGGGTQSASNTYRDGAGFDVSGAAEAVSGNTYDPDYVLPEYDYDPKTQQYTRINPVAETTASAAPKLGPTGQPVDASGGYYGPYGQYFNAAGQPQMWYMDPANYGPDAILSAKTAGVALKAPKTAAAAAASAPIDTLEGLEALYQKNLGRAADTSGIESYMGKGYTPEQITGFMKSSEEYAPIKTRLDEEAKQAAEKAKQATYANPTQIANMYSNILNRTPDMGGLDYYTGQNLTPAEVKQQLMQSEEYKQNLTKPFVAPISYTGSRLSYADIKNQLGHDPSYQEVKTAGEAFIPNRATIQGAPEYQTPEQQMGLAPTKPRDQTPDFYAEMNKKLAEQANKANGGIAGMYAAGGDIQGYNLGGYSDGGRLLRGPGDGVSDDIPATIGDRQPARLADGEFVIPARIVSELGNGSTEAGAKRLYAMMDRVQKARRKTVGKGNVAVNSKADKHLPA